MVCLTEEQINEIKEKYTESIEVINDIQDDLNELDIIDDPEDFYDIVCSTCVAFEGMKDETIRKINEHNQTIRTLNEYSETHQNEIVLGDLNRFVEQIMPIKSILIKEIRIKYNGEEAYLFNNKKLSKLL